MVTTYKYYKNSNTGDVVKSQTFSETTIKNIPVFYFRNGEPIGENLELIGYVEISKKSYDRICKKLLRDE